MEKGVGCAHLSGLAGGMEKEGAPTCQVLPNGLTDEEIAIVEGR
jgi:hypothetical protein